MSDALPGLPLIRYRFDVQAVSPIRLPDYAGSLLRGAFGRALRQVACITGERDCEPCGLKRGCPYIAVFAPGRPEQPHPLLQNSNIPAPYVIEPPEWGARVVRTGDSFSFHMVLIGRAVDHVAIIILAWRRALARGLGPGDGAGELIQVVADDGKTIYTPQDGRVLAHTAKSAASPTAVPKALTLRFITPLRLQENGHALAPHRLSIKALVLAAARRGSLLAEFHSDGAPTINFKQLVADASRLTEQRRLEWRDWTRYSSRQKQTMTLGGVIGEWSLAGNLESAWPWLRAGQDLHLGKETVFGMGHYRLESIPPGDISASKADSCEPPSQVTERKEENV